MFELNFVRSQVQIIGFDERDAGGIVFCPPHDGRVGTWGQIRSIAASRSSVGARPASSIAACCESFQSSSKAICVPSELRPLEGRILQRISDSKRA